MTDVTPELWQPVLDHTGLYDASSTGEIHSLPRYDLAGRWLQGCILKQQQDEFGRMSVALHKDGVQKTYRVHRLVAEAFLGPCPAGMEVAHWDDVPWNNEISNLRFATSKENKADARRNGRNYFLNVTHCPYGHEYTPDNTYVARDGGRECRTCANERSILYRLERAESGPWCINGCNAPQIAFGLCVRCYTRKRSAELRDPEWENLVCPHCKKAFVRLPELGQGKRKYCSDGCAREAKLLKNRERMRQLRATGQ